MAEDELDESGSFSEETETDDELSDPATQRESTAKDLVRRKKDKALCQNWHESPLWQELLLDVFRVAWMIVEATLGLPLAAATSPEGRNEIRDSIIRTYCPGSGTTAVDGGRRTRRQKKKKQKICNIL